MSKLLIPKQVVPVNPVCVKLIKKTPYPKKTMIPFTCYWNYILVPFVVYFIYFFSSGAHIAIFTHTPLCLPQPHWLAIGPWLVILHRNSDSSVVWTDMDRPEERLWYAAAPRRPPRPQRGAPVLDHSKGKPARHPVTSMTLFLWKWVGGQSVQLVICSYGP